MATTAPLTGTFCLTPQRSRYLQLCVGSEEGWRVSRALHAGGQALGSRETTPGDAAVPGSHSWDEASQVRSHRHTKNVTALKHIGTANSPCMVASGGINSINLNTDIV